MPELLNHIFGSLDRIEDTLLRQTKTNRTLAVISAVLIAYSIHQNKRIRDLEEDVDAILEKETDKEE